MSISNSYENTLLDYITSTVLWVGLSTADPLDTAAGLAEPSSGAYARVEVPSTYWADAASGSVTTDTAITFPRATGSWGTVTHVCIFNAASGGTLLWSGALGASLAVTSGMQPQFAIGALTLTLD